MPPPRKSPGSSSRSPAAKRSTRSPGPRGSPGGPPSSRSPGSAAADPDPGLVQQGVNALRDNLAGVADSLNLVMVSRERLQVVFDNAVSRGHITRETGNRLVAEIVHRGRRELEDVLADTDQLVGRLRGTPGADLALQQVDRARRAVGAGPALPILGYDDLTAAQIAERLDALSPAQLRKLRDYERRHGNRKSVLAAVEKRLQA